MLNYITQLHVQNFRCLEKYELSCSPTTNIIVGDNGSGKTTVFESIYYGCFLRSFRTKQTRDMIMFDRPALHATLKGKSSLENWEIRIGLSQEQRKVNVNNQKASSFKDLLNCYQTLYIASDDNTLITGEPEKRRNFFDRTIVLQDTSYGHLLRRYNRILKQRNAALQRTSSQSACDVWTRELWDLSKKIQTKRLIAMEEIFQKTHSILQKYFQLHSPIQFSYEQRGIQYNTTYEKFCDTNKHIIAKEHMCKYSCFGAHRDDILISWHDKKTKQFASRGQQKLIVLAMKIAQAQCLPKKPIFLIDDFITDFDSNKLKSAAKALLEQKSQLFIATPFLHENFTKALNAPNICSL